MAVTAKSYGLFAGSALRKRINWETDTIKAMLCAVTYVPDQDTHEFKSQVTNEITGTNYTAGGLVVPNRTIAYDTATNTTKLLCDNLVWNDVTFNTFPRILVIYSDTGTATDSPLISWMDFGANQSATAQPFVVTAPANGIATFTTA